MIRAVTMSEEEVRAECDAAVADADLAPEQARFFRLAGLGLGHVAAAWFRPHTDIEAGDQAFPGDDALREEANSDENRNLHRITIPAEPTDRALFSGLVRHELEHARQWEARLRIFDLHDFIEHDILPEVAGGLDGCAGGLINTIPTEMDCNAAASVYITGRFSADDVQAIRDSARRYLACSLTLPPPPETLPARMIAFAYLHRAAVERHAERRGFAVAAILRSVHPKAPAFWARLEEPL
jgi:hypothetical protein